MPWGRVPEVLRGGIQNISLLKLKKSIENSKYQSWIFMFFW